MFFAVLFQLTELSSIFILSLPVMKLSGVSRDSLAYRTVRGAKMITFFLTRIATIPLTWYEFINVLLDPESQIISSPVKIFMFSVFIVLHSLFIYWFALIIRTGTYKGRYASIDNEIKEKNT